MKSIYIVPAKALCVVDGLIETEEGQPEARPVLAIQYAQPLASILVRELLRPFVGPAQTLVATNTMEGHFYLHVICGIELPAKVPLPPTVMLRSKEMAPGGPWLYMAGISAQIPRLDFAQFETHRARARGQFLLGCCDTATPQSRESFLDGWFVEGTEIIHSNLDAEMKRRYGLHGDEKLIRLSELN